MDSPTDGIGPMVVHVVMAIDMDDSVIDSVWLDREQAEARVEELNSEQGRMGRSWSEEHEVVDRGERGEII